MRKDAIPTGNRPPETPPCAASQAWEAWSRMATQAWNRRYGSVCEPDKNTPGTPDRHPIRIDHKPINEVVLICPVCGMDYVHPVGLTCHAAGARNTSLRVDAHGVSLDPHSAPMGRGVTITLECLCESGHRFDYRFHFHKGQTFLEADVSKKELPFEEQPKTIWRD